MLIKSKVKFIKNSWNDQHQQLGVWCFLFLYCMVHVLLVSFCDVQYVIVFIDLGRCTRRVYFLTKTGQSSQLFLCSSGTTYTYNPTWNLQGHVMLHQAKYFVAHCAALNFVYFILSMNLLGVFLAVVGWQFGWLTCHSFLWLVKFC